MAGSEKKEQIKSALKKARLLMDCQAGCCNQVIEDIPEIIDALVASGHADDHPDAIAYAESLRATPFFYRDNL